MKSSSGIFRLKIIFDIHRDCIDTYYYITLCEGFLLHSELGGGELGGQDLPQNSFQPQLVFVANGKRTSDTMNFGTVEG